MIPTKLAETLKATELRKLVNRYAREANAMLKELYAAGADKLSPAFVNKWRPYLAQHGKRGGFFRQDVSRGTKKDLINRLQNLQYFRESMKSPEEIEDEAQETAEQFGLNDPEKLADLFRLVEQGFNSLSYKIGSDDMFKIVAERLNDGQSAEEIEQEIKDAAEMAENGDEFISIFSAGGKWL